MCKYRCTCLKNCLNGCLQRLLRGVPCGVTRRCGCEGLCCCGSSARQSARQSAAEPGEQREGSPAAGDPGEQHPPSPCDAFRQTQGQACTVVFKIGWVSPTCALHMDFRVRESGRRASVNAESAARSLSSLSNKTRDTALNPLGC